MEELFELREHIERGRYEEALAVLGEMEEMSRDDKINKIESYMEILLIHLIKRHAEKRSTRSWDVSIRNSVHKIDLINVRRRAGGTYLNGDELREVLEDAWEAALARASLETLEGRFEEAELSARIDRDTIMDEAMGLIETKGPSVMG